MKPTNKAGQPVAEPVEPRAGAEGTAGRQSTLRAQNRKRVTQALDRVRQAAKERKKERFTTLLHHISLDLLRLAFFALKRDAAPGIDGLTWRDYESDLERNLEDLHARAHRGAYRALPTVVPTKSFATLGGIIEINLLALTNTAAREKQVISPAWRRMGRASSAASSCFPQD
jgi:hypothetical protein